MLEADEDDTESEESDNEREDDEMAVEDAITLDELASPTERTATFAEPGATSRKASRGGRDGGMDISDWTFDTDDGLAKQLSFDIFLKGNLSRATSFFKTSAGTMQRFRMFPYIERKRRVDSYGETIDVGAWLRKGKQLEEDAESEESRDGKRRKLDEDEAKVPIFGH